MIIWRGWGALAVIYIGVCVGILGGLIGASVLGSSTMTGPLVGLGLIIGGALTAVHGWYLNIVRPRKRADEWAASERSRLEAAADEGTLVIGNVRPNSREQAGEQIDQVIDQGRRTIGKHGPHSVFWIPMEAIGIMAVIGGLIVAVVTLIGALAG